MKLVSILKSTVSGKLVHTLTIRICPASHFYTVCLTVTARVNAAVSELVIKQRLRDLVNTL